VNVFESGWEIVPGRNYKLIFDISKQTSSSESRQFCVRDNTINKSAKRVSVEWLDIAKATHLSKSSLI
jgi:hypothetical protein